MPILFISIFVGLFVVVLVAISIGLMFYQQQRRRAISSALKNPHGNGRSEDSASILASDARPAFQFLSGPSAEKATAYLQQSGLSWPVSQLLAISAVGAVVGFAFGDRVSVLVFPLFGRIATALLLGVLPWAVVARQRKRRLGEIEKQFPEALDFLARSMRAGHAFTISLDMLGQETPEPLGQEIRTLYNEQNLGAPLEVALNNFASRIPLLDIRFFVSTVLLQRQTGGNLSEVLLRLSNVIRERFKLKGQVKAVSAHGRITAAVLTLMPIGLAAGLMATSPEYLESFAADPDGKWLLIAAVVGQIIGYLFIRKIVNIKV